MTDAFKRTSPPRRILRGHSYSMSEFAGKYRLDEHEAKRLFDKFGPSATELDLLMAAKHRMPDPSFELRLQ